jgi:hypothetical protein
MTVIVTGGTLPPRSEEQSTGYTCIPRVVSYGFGGRMSNER